jgi:hypothetical protein
MERVNLPPLSESPDECETVSLEQVEVRRYVGGLIASFERTAA